MQQSLSVRLGVLVVLGSCMTVSCTHPRTELELTAYDQTRDQRKIADYYSQEATNLRHQAEELSARVVVYERLFGPNSDWVTGTRLLAQSYEEAAKEHERMAGKHLGLANRGHPSQLARPEAR